MKKFLLGGLAAVCAAVGFSSYTTQTFSGPYYFKVNAGVNKAKASGAVFNNGEITRISVVGDATCGTNQPYDCVITFATNLLTATNFSQLKTPASQAPRSTVATRASL